MFIIVYFYFIVKQGSFQLLSEFLRTGRALIFLERSTSLGIIFANYEIYFGMGVNNTGEVVYI